MWYSRNTKQLIGFFCSFCDPNTALGGREKTPFQVHDEANDSKKVHVHDPQDSFKGSCCKLFMKNIHKSTPLLSQANNSL